MFGEWALKEGLLTEARIKEMQQSVMAEVEDAVQFADESPKPVRTPPAAGGLRRPPLRASPSVLDPRGGHLTTRTRRLIRIQPSSVPNTAGSIVQGSRGLHRPVWKINEAGNCLRASLPTSSKQCQSTFQRSRTCLENSVDHLMGWVPEEAQAEPRKYDNNEKCSITAMAK